MADLTSRRPYLIRALYDWVLDNGLTPHLLVAADAPRVIVPRQFVTEENKITINIAPSAVRGLTLDNDEIAFSARFSGDNFDVCIPPGAVLALYARENGEGMLFGEAENIEAESEEPAGLASGTEDDKRSHLRVVK